MEVKLSKSELGELDFTHVTNLERRPQAFLNNDLDYIS